MAGQPHRADGDHRHGGRGLPGPERDRRPRQARAWTSARTAARMNSEDLAEKFKAADDPLRLVFVCAMWMTGFDAPSVSTIYLDRPMRNHTLMQTIARANRVFPDKDNGLIVDYIGVFRDLEKALAIYGAANAEAGVDSPDPGHRRARRGAGRARSTSSSGSVRRSRRRPDRAARRERASRTSRFGTPRWKRCWSTRRLAPTFLAAARQVRKLFKALLPDPSGRRAPAHRRRHPGAGRADRRRVPTAAGRSRGDRRCRRRAARPVGRGRGVRDPGRRRRQRAGPAHRPVPDRLRCARRNVRRPQAGRDRPARGAAEAARRRRRRPATRPATTWSSASRS